jgi:hypothetical protein
MAISRAQLLAELLPALNELFGLEYEKGWAVHHKNGKITKVEPWDGLKHMKLKGKKRISRPNIIHINEAIDELDAYMKAKKALEQTT